MGHGSRKSSTDTNMSMDALSIPDTDSTCMVNHLGTIRHDALFESYKKSSLGLENQAELSHTHEQVLESNTGVEAMQMDGADEPSRREPSQSKECTDNFSLVAQTRILITRSHLNSIRNPGFHVSYLVGGVSFLFYGLVYLGLRTSSLVDSVRRDIPPYYMRI